MLILSSAIAVVMVPAAYSYFCSVVIDGVDYPSSVNTGQTFQVTTHVTATCTSQLSEPASVRVDIIDPASQSAISSGVFNPGYAFAVFGGGTTSGAVTNSVNAPSFSLTWNLVIEASFFWQSALMSSAQKQITVQVGSNQPPESVISVSVLQNGGFETSTASWQLVQGSSGYESISTSVTHSGTHALAITLISPPPGSNAFAPSTVGASQTVSVSSLRGLNVQGWYLTRFTVTSAAARVRVKVDGLTLSYYVVSGPLTQGTSGDTPTSKSMLMSSVMSPCPTWCEFSRDVGSDIRSLFSPSAVSSVFSSETTTITIALEILGYGSTAENQFIFWDDVQLSVQVPNQSTSSTSANTSSQSVQLTVTSSSNSSLGPTLSTTTETKTVGFVLALTTEQIYGSIAAAFAIAFVVVFTLLLMTRKKLRGQPPSQ